MKVLVTGGTGFIGSHLVSALGRRGQDVRCLVRSRSSVDRLRSNGVELAWGDVADESSVARAVADVDVVYHLAGAIKALRASDYLRVNETGTRNVARACAARTSPPALVLLSSLSAAGPAPAGRLRTEADAPAPVSNYGRSKRLGEVAAEQVARDVPLTILRPPIVFGEEDREMLNMVQPIVASGLHVVPTLATRRFSLVYAGDLADVLIEAADRGARVRPGDGNVPGTGSGYYFPAYDEHPTYAGLGRLIGQAVGREHVRVLHAPAPLTWLFAATVQIVSQVRRRPSVISLDKVRESNAGDWTCSPSKTREEIGFSPLPLSDRLRTTTDWYRRQGWL